MLTSRSASVTLHAALHGLGALLDACVSATYLQFMQHAAIAPLRDVRRASCKHLDVVLLQRAYGLTALHACFSACTLITGGTECTMSRRQATTAKKTLRMQAWACEQHARQSWHGIAVSAATRLATGRETGATPLHGQHASEHRRV